MATMGARWVDSDDLPRCFVYPARRQQTASVFFLHGLGDNAFNFSQSLETVIEYPELDHVKFIFPTAPRMKVTGLRGSTVASWFDYYSFNAVKRQEDEEGLRKAAKWIQNLIEKEITESNISSDRIVVGGISQGGAVSLLTGLTTERPLAGIFCLSTYIPLRSKVPEFATAQARTLPILWCHGNIDMKMDVDVWKDLAETLADQLGIPFRTSTENSTASRKLGDDSDWKNYVMDLARDLGIESPAGLNSTSANHSSVNELLLVERGKGELHFRTYRGLGHKLDDKELRDLALWLSTLIPPA